MIIKENILHYEEPKIEEEALQATTVNMQANNKTFTATAIYCPPRNKLEKKDYIQFFGTQGNNFIRGGDSNAKHKYWGSRLTTAKEKSLYEAGMEMKCEFHSIGKPTYWPADTNKTPDVIDFIVVKGVSANYNHVEVSYDLASDHSPIILTLWDTVVNRQVPPFLTNRKTDWEEFREDLGN